MMKLLPAIFSRTKPSISMFSVEKTTNSITPQIVMTKLPIRITSDYIQVGDHLKIDKCCRNCAHWKLFGKWRGNCKKAVFSILDMSIPGDHTCGRFKLTKELIEQIQFVCQQLATSSKKAV